MSKLTLFKYQKDYYDLMIFGIIWKARRYNDIAGLDYSAGLDYIESVFNEELKSAREGTMAKTKTKKKATKKKTK